MTLQANTIMQSIWSENYRSIRRTRIRFILKVLLFALYAYNTPADYNMTN